MCHDRGPIARTAKAKESKKRSMRKGKKVGQPNAKMKKVKDPKVSSAETTVPENNDEGASCGIQKDGEKPKHLSGFIFMCNSRTKLECYQYRVFGLPSGKREVVEEIKPGMKLFLFDFEKKLLYGIYVATSAGQLNLEPSAFRGNFPAQVNFKIFKECLPLPESYLRHVIRENYKGLKFKQELSRKQVNKLLSSFRPLTASSQPIPRPLENVQLSHTSSSYIPYLAQHRFVPSLVEPHSVAKVNFMQHGYHREAPYAEHVNPTLDHRSLPANGSFYITNFQQSHGAKEPPYSRYRTIDERPSHDQITHVEMRYRTMEERAPHDQLAILERHHHQLPLQRKTLHQDNMTAYNLHPSAPAEYPSSAQHHLPLERDTQYLDSAVAYNSNSAAASVSQPHGPSTYQQLPLPREALYRDNVVAYNSYSAVSTQYGSPAVQPQVTVPGISQGSADPMSSYYSYSAAAYARR